MKPRESRHRNNRLLDLRMRQVAQANAPPSELERMQEAAMEMLRQSLEAMHEFRRSTVGASN